MSKPEDIPQDVWDAADGTTNRISSELVKALTGGTEATADGLIQAHVARAIMAERERCAKIAALYVFSPEAADHSSQAVANNAGMNIAAAIRKGAQ